MIIGGVEVEFPIGPYINKCPMCRGVVTYDNKNRAFCSNCDFTMFSGSPISCYCEECKWAAYSIFVAYIGGAMRCSKHGCTVHSFSTLKDDSGTISSYLKTIKERLQTLPLAVVVDDPVTSEYTNKIVQMSSAVSIQFAGKVWTFDNLDVDSFVDMLYENVKRTFEGLEVE